MSPVSSKRYNAQPVWLRWSRSPVENRYPPHDALPLEAPGGWWRVSAALKALLNWPEVF